MLRSITQNSGLAAAAGTGAATDESIPEALSIVRDPVNELLCAFLRARVAELTELDPALERIGQEVFDLVTAPGKRLRPAFVYWGHRATGADHDQAVLSPAAAMELLHVFALIHDDVMDRSPQRRGRPAVHEALAATHDHDGLHGDGGWFGVGGAILAGDLAFVWADQLFDEAGLPADALARARRTFTQLRVEVMAGQYLDLRLAGQATAAEEYALRVALLKSGRYTVTRPLQLGAAIGGSDQTLDAALRAFGDAVGLAFQLRDDVLGLFGDPQATGKGALEDLREGKRTFLVLRALRRSRAAQRTVLLDALGDPNVTIEQAERARQVVTESGALQAVERLVSEQQARARRALASVDPPAREALTALADLAAFRAV